MENFLLNLHSSQAHSQVGAADGSPLLLDGMTFGAQPLQGIVNYAGLGPGSMNMTAGNMASLAFLQQQQRQQLQHQQQQQQQLQRQQHQLNHLHHQQQQQQNQQQDNHHQQNQQVYAELHATASFVVGSLPVMAAQPGVPKTVGRKTGKPVSKQQVVDQRAGAESGSGSDSEGGSSDGEENRSRKRPATGGGSDDAERRHQALQEKNRRAQRRFRERQKSKLQELQAKINELTSKVTNLQSENSSLFSRTNILEKVLDMRNEQIQVMQEAKEASSILGDESTATLGITGKLVHLTPENLKALDSNQIFKIYQMYVKELSKHLEERPDNVQGLEVVVEDLGNMILRIGVMKPLETRRFIVTSRQGMGTSEAEITALWASITRALGLSDPQKQMILEMRQSFLHKVEPVLAERNLLNQQIQSEIPEDSFATKNALSYIRAHEAVLKLRDNLKVEQRLLLEFSMNTLRSALTPLQAAQLFLKCYPAVPDALGIAAAVSPDLGQPQLRDWQLTMRMGGYFEGTSLSTSGSHATAANNTAGRGSLVTLDSLPDLGTSNSILASAGLDGGFMMAGTQDRSSSGPLLRPSH